MSRKHYTPKNCLFKDEHDTMRPDSKGECFCCHLKIGPTWDERVQMQVDAISDEDKQKLLDELKTKNVGDAIKAVDPEGKHESLAWFTFIGSQIDVHTYETFDHTLKK